MRFFTFIRRLIIVFAYAAGISILLMMGITVLDVVLRLFNIGITGAYDLVRAFGVVSVACALPYVTAAKGHIAIEFFYHKCGKRGRLILDFIFRISALVIFGSLTYYTFGHGLSLYQSGEVFPNLGMPVFWIPFVISLNCLLMMVVFVYHLIHPGKEFIKP
ncbi:TRAP transporter small permease [Oceanispirochaeta crateris]|jgi:TRAP-type C4-dicarboxylate transport system permease small subunit|uniref:TRAP transporter small permease n=1 Tax=Oceanispirochaeta crateris TaxID=2518645 RepID=A0A5C1QLX8_9SPIO|nr:TRAP transporter small permease [Oceanispirochaeta crateris]QEN08219.1 TRAP transporter small permease [Oceanispirochaeta crateris]